MAIFIKMPAFAHFPASVFLDGPVFVRYNKKAFMIFTKEEI